MLRVPQHLPGHKRSGRRRCAISERPTPSSARKSLVSLIIPVHPRNAPVNAIIPVHTQKQGVEGAFFEFSTLNFQRFLSADMTNRSISGSLPSGSSSNILSAAGHCNRYKENSGTVDWQLITVNDETGELPLERRLDHASGEPNTFSRSVFPHKFAISSRERPRVSGNRKTKPHRTAHISA
jgi:hypothetical protein